MINKLVEYKIDRMVVICKITDVKQVYGRFIYKLIPTAGSGYKWTNKVPGSAELPYNTKG